MPQEGLITGLFAQGVAHKLNLQYSFRAGLFILPIVAQVLLRSTQVEGYFRTLEFMDFTLNARKAKGLLEMEKMESKLFNRFSAELI